MWAQAAGPAVTDWLSVVIQGGALGLLAYLVVYTGPSILRDGRAEREQLSRQHREDLVLMQQGFAARTEATVRAIEQQTAQLLGELRHLAAALREDRRNPQPP